jgi:hypothetical protein
MTTPALTARSAVIVEELEKFDINDRSPVAQQCAGTMLLLSAIVGTKKARIKAMARFGKSHVDTIEKRLRKNGVWVHGKLCHSGWFDDPDGGIAFICDVLCGTGSVARSA